MEEVRMLTEEDEFDAGQATEEAGEAPVIRLCNLILVDAIKRNASDIHIEPYEYEFRIRYRIDGVLSEIMRPPMRMRQAIIPSENYVQAGYRGASSSAGWSY